MPFDAETIARVTRQHIELASPHPVYARQEDNAERGRQAEECAGEMLKRYFYDLLRLPVPAEERPLLCRLQDDIADALAGAFVDGWNAARAEQQR